MSKWTWKDNVLWMDDVGIEMKSEVDAAAVATTHNSTEPFDLCSEGHVITPEESRCQFGHPRRVTPTTQQIAAEAGYQRCEGCGDPIVGILTTPTGLCHELCAKDNAIANEHNQSLKPAHASEVCTCDNSASDVITAPYCPIHGQLRAAHASEQSEIANEIGILREVLKALIVWIAQSSVGVISQMDAKQLIDKLEANRT